MAALMYGEQVILDHFDHPIGDFGNDLPTPILRLADPTVNSVTWSLVFCCPLSP